MLPSTTGRGPRTLPLISLLALLFISTATAAARELELPPGAKLAEFKSPGNSTIEPLPAIGGRSLLESRQSCREGYGWCSNTGCCQLEINCCSWGYCLESNEHVCCPGGSCEPGWNCCGKEKCVPVGGDCCHDESHCKPGYYCYKLENGAAGCWPRNGGGGGGGGGRDDDDDDDGEETTPPETTPEPTSRGGGGGGGGDDEETTPAPTISADYQWYTTYISWSYWSYRYTRWLGEQTVTSSRYTTTTTISVYATDSLEATDSFSEMSATMSFPTPPSATALASLTGITPTSEPTNSPDSPNGDGSGDNFASTGHEGYQPLLALRSRWSIACVAVAVLAPGILMVQL